MNDSTSFSYVDGLDKVKGEQFKSCVFCHSGAMPFCGLFVSYMISLKTGTGSSEHIKGQYCGEHRQERAVSAGV